MMINFLYLARLIVCLPSMCSMLAFLDVIEVGLMMGFSWFARHISRPHTSADAATEVGVGPHVSTARRSVPLGRSVFCERKREVGDGEP